MKKLETHEKAYHITETNKAYERPLNRTNLIWEGDMNNSIFESMEFYYTVKTNSKISQSKIALS